ncbi:MAG: hypothetical protein HY208_00485 [Nitrospirae bacterium]|nr:hypothetical protein [Nitrospirota bacterium]
MMRYHYRVRRVFFFLLAVAGATVALAGLPSPSARAQTTAPVSPSNPEIEYHADKRTVTVHLNGMPLRQVIEELSQQTQIRFRPPAQAQAFDNRPITASLEQMPIERAIKQLLGPSNTVIIYGAQHTANGRRNYPAITEVRVFDLGIIPIVATAIAPDSGNQPARSSNPAKLAENQAIRDAKKQKRSEKKQGGSSRKGGRGGSNTSQNQSSSQSADPTNASNSTKPSSNANNSDQSKSGGSGGKQ